MVVISRCTTLNHLRVNIKHFLGPILGAEVAQKCAPFPAVVTITEMDNANLHKNLRFLRPSHKKETVF